MEDVHSIISGASDHSGHTSTTTSNSSTLSMDVPVFHQSMAVDRTWEQGKAMEGYEETFGEQIVLRMMEMDPSARKDLGIVSLRSENFSHICNALVVIVDSVVCLMGPTVEEFEEEIIKIGQQCQSEGIKVILLGGAVSEAVKLVLHKLSEEDYEARKNVIDFVARKMLR
jgi:hypothetical protein